MKKAIQGGHAHDTKPTVHPATCRPPCRDLPQLVAPAQGFGAWAPELPPAQELRAAALAAQGSGSAATAALAPLLEVLASDSQAAGGQGAAVGMEPA